jgi:AcrR family transcriptional regulator
MQRKEDRELDGMIEKSLAAFIVAGTLDLSLDHLAVKVGISKRMLIHYFGNRENIEQKALAALEDRLRDRFRADRFPAGVSLEIVVKALWEQSTAPESRGVLLVIMDASRRAWSGSDRAKAFYAEQQRLWVELLLKYLPDARAVEELLQLFQGAIFAFLITGDRDQGRRTLARMISREAATSKAAVEEPLSNENENNL